MNLLFFCTIKVRSRSAEIVFGVSGKYVTKSAGTSKNAAVPITPELLRRPDAIFVMEDDHEKFLKDNFKKL